MESGSLSRNGGHMIDWDAHIMFRAAWLILLSASLLAPAQEREAPANTPAAPMAMPSDRAVDSYRIYSSLMPLGETAGPGWPHELWLLGDTTVTIVASNEPCKYGRSRERDDMNPHNVVHPTDDRRQDFAEILEDFDQHCHDRVRLRPDAWSGPVPVRLLNAGEQDRFRKSRSTREPTPEFEGAPALYEFSEVYFNAKHTVSLVYATHFCGGLCGEGFWVALALENGEWKRLRWRA